MHKYLVDSLMNCLVHKLFYTLPSIEVQVSRKQLGMTIISKDVCKVALGVLYFLLNEMAVRDGRKEITPIK